MLFHAIYQERCAYDYCMQWYYFNFTAGSTIYVHGNNARPQVIGCSIIDSENVGIFVNNGAQVHVTRELTGDVK